MARASSQTVLGDFNGQVELDDGRVRLGPDQTMDLEGPGAHERRAVDLVLASGRQHQLYVTHGSDGSYALLPIIWATQAKKWLPTAMYQPGDLDPHSKNYWAGSDLSRGCFSCHLSQAYRSTQPPESRWIDLSINCESCHGPGAEHIRRRRAGRSDESYRSLRGLGRDEEARVCGQCHGFSLKPYVFPAASDGLPQIFVASLINGGLRPDGTQKSTSYQYPGHVLSQCFRNGALTCSGCHQPHSLAARSFIGETASGKDADRQCAICHRDKTPSHTHHKNALRCVDCHMSYSYIGDDPRRLQRTADHSISIPRPEESLRFGTPNACTTCHADRSAQWALDVLRRWGSTPGVRDWVEAIALGRKSAPGAGDRLVKLLDSDSAYLQASALDLLLLQPPDGKRAPLLERFARSDDPQLRAPAIRALMSYDAPRWAAIGLGDAHPFVRMETFSFIKDVSLLTPAAIDRDLADTLAYKRPPVDGLVHLITVRHRRHELKEAQALLDLLERIALPHERARLGIEAVRARLQTAP
jgi:hypothetical protein